MSQFAQILQSDEVQELTLVKKSFSICSSCYVAQHGVRFSMRKLLIRQQFFLVDLVSTQLIKNYFQNK